MIFEGALAVTSNTLTSIPYTILYVALALGIAGLAVSSIMVRSLEGRLTWSSFGLRTTQAVLATLGLGGAFLHAYPSTSAKDAATPNVDLVSLAYIGLIVVAFLLNNIESFEFGGLKFKRFKEEATKTVNESIAAATEVRKALRAWPQTLGTLFENFALADDDELDERWTNFKRDRLGDAKQLLANSVNDRIRLAIWIYIAEGNVIEFDDSNEINDEATTTATFRPGEGFLGQAFEEGRTLNEADAAMLPSFKTIVERRNYRGVLAVPIVLGSEKLGVLTIDRPEAEEFSDASVAIAEACAATIALALDRYTTYIDARSDQGNDVEDTESQEHV
jgi:hypothetical protein